MKHICVVFFCCPSMFTRHEMDSVKNWRARNKSETSGPMFVQRKADLREVLHGDSNAATCQWKCRNFRILQLNTKRIEEVNIQGTKNVIEGEQEKTILWSSFDVLFRPRAPPTSLESLCRRRFVGGTAFQQAEQPIVMLRSLDADKCPCFFEFVVLFCFCCFF